MEYLNENQRQVQPTQGQQTPLNAWETNNFLMVEVPLPGIKPENIAIEVSGNNLTIYGKVTGSHGENKTYLTQEWSLGPYQRTYQLPHGVDTVAANASFGDGILVITLPKAQTTQAGQIKLERVGSGQGLAQGHAGGGENVTSHHASS